MEHVPKKLTKVVTLVKLLITSVLGTKISSSGWCDFYQNSNAPVFTIHSLPKICIYKLQFIPIQGFTFGLAIDIIN